MKGAWGKKYGTDRPFGIGPDVKIFVPCTCSPNAPTVWEVLSIGWVRRPTPQMSALLSPSKLVWFNYKLKSLFKVPILLKLK